MKTVLDTKTLCELIENRKEELFSLLSEYVKIDSRNFASSGKEKPMAQRVLADCLSLGLEAEMYSPLSVEGFEKNPDYLPGRSLEERYNVTARWRGESDADELMLMGHLDTVDTGSYANWERDPFSGEIADGKIFGRGACDDKYALATSVFLIRLLKDAGFSPKRNLVFAAYCDEEHGGSHGAMAAVMKTPTERIVNMDGRNEIWHCASGGQVVIYRYHTKDTVDSAERGGRAIPIVMNEIARFAEARRAELEANRFYAGTIIPSTSLRYNEIRAGRDGTDLGVGELKFTFYTDKTKDEIYAELAAIEKTLSEKLAPLGIVGDGFIPDTRFFHYGFSEPNADAITDMVEAAREVTGDGLRVCGSCLSDLSVILKYGNSNAFAFGAGRDFSLKGGAHQPNEYIECEGLLKYAKIIGAYILRVLG